MVKELQMAKPGFSPDPTCSKTPALNHRAHYEMNKQKLLQKDAMPPQELEESLQ